MSIQGNKNKIMRIKKGDNVIIITGKDKGKSGKVERVLPKQGKLIVDGLNLMKSHQRPRRQDQKGQVIEKSMPITASNVMMVDPKTKKPTKVGKKADEQGKLKRFSRASGSFID
jgi:large subunit ribosomal protein L24